MESGVSDKLVAVGALEKKNWLVHILFLRQEYKECLNMIETQTKNSVEKSEFLLFMKGLIYRIEGKIAESLETFKQCHVLNPSNVYCQKEVGKAL